MIHGIRKLAREIHRRSVWQVVGAYGLLSWATFAAVRLLTNVVGLPTWTPTMALVLLAILFPLVVATAVVQGGIPGLRIVDEVDPNELVGFTPDQVHVVPQAHPLYGMGLLTWRNTVLGAVSSAALLVTTVVAYLVMWALGIGPVGSLVAQGLVEEQDWALVAAFVNHTDDPTLGAVVTDAFEMDLAESDVVSVVGPDRTRDALSRMGREPTAPLTAPVARELARLENIAVVIEGDVARRGRGYVVTAAVVLAEGNFVAARFDETASDDTELLLALARLGERVRERLGESLWAIRRGETMVLVVTESGDALRLYGRAGQASVAGEHTEAADFLRQAVGVDPAFAMAWRKLGTEYEQMGDTARAIDAYRRAVSVWADAGTGGRRTAETLRERIATLGG